ncbi:hypothetical protein MMC30_007645 [Trapelia coarctata]|nr:hypothetical protein [Trapelia coarctata]
MSCTASSHTATGYAQPYAGQNLITGYCQVNGFVTPTKSPDPATLVATSELSKLPITKAQPSISLVSDTQVMSAPSTTSNFTNSLETTATSFESTNVVYTSTRQPAQSSSTGTTSTNVSSSTSVGPSRLTVVMIVAFATVGLVLIIFIVLLRRHLRSIFSQIRSSFNNQGKINDAQPEVFQTTAAYHETGPIVNANNETSSTISHSNGERLSAGGWTVSTSSDRPERKIWTQWISLFSKPLNGWVPAVAKIDTGTEHNWIHPKLVEKGKFPTESVARRSFQGYAEKFTCDRTTTITLQSIATSKQLETTFNVGHEAANFEVLLGLGFAITENLVRVNSEPHVFNIEDLVSHTISVEGNEGQIEC